MSDAEVLNSNEEGVRRLLELQKRPQYIIPIQNCLPNDYNENKMNKVRLEALKNFILMKGQIGDIVVRPQGQYDFSSPPSISDKFIIVDGYHRHLALTELGMPKIAVKIVDYTEQEARVATIAFNKIHGSTSEIGERRILDGYWTGNDDNIQSIVMMDYVDLVAPPEPDIDYTEPSAMIDTPVSPDLAFDTSISNNESNNNKSQLSSNNSNENSKAETGDVKGPPRENPPVKAEATFALPYFFKQSDYEYLTDMCAKMRTKHGFDNMSESFVYAFRQGENAMAHSLENDRLKKQVEKLEQADNDRKEKARKRKEEKMLKQLAKEKENKEKELAKGKNKQ